MIRKFTCKIEREWEYEIEIDDELMNEDFLENYRKYFFDVETLEEHIERIAMTFSRDEDGFIEGYGSIYVDGRPENKYYIPEGTVLPPKMISLKVISDDMYGTYCEEE